MQNNSDYLYHRWLELQRKLLNCTDTRKEELLQKKIECVSDLLTDCLTVERSDVVNE